MHHLFLLAHVNSISSQLSSSAMYFVLSARYAVKKIVLISTTALHSALYISPLGNDKKFGNSKRK